MIDKTIAFMTVEETQAELLKVNEARKLQNLDPLTELPAPPAPTEIDDSKVFEALSKKLGKTITSYEDLTPKAAPTPEEIKKKQEERATARTAWALANKKVSADELNDFIKEGSNVENLFYADFAAKRKAAKPDLEDEDIRAEFDALKQKVGDDTIAVVGNTMLQKKYGKFLKLDEEYAAYENEQLTTAQFNDKVKKEAPVYIGINNDAIGAFVKDGIEIEFPVEGSTTPVKLTYKPDATIAEQLRASMTSEESVTQAVKDGYDKTKQQAILKNAIIGLDIAGFTKQIYQQATLNKQAIVRGLPNMYGKDAKPLTPSEEEARVAANQKLLKDTYSQVEN